MKQNRIMFAALAMAALLMTSCGKDSQGFDSFVLSTADFNDANGSKAHWDASGYWWENATSSTDPTCDAVLINGTSHNIYYDGTNHLWKTHGDAVSPDGGYFYVVYAGSMTPSNYSSRTYGPVTFDGTFVPLSAKGQGNSLTLYPCCAVLKVNQQVPIRFTITSGSIATGGYIDADNNEIINSTGTTNLIAKNKYCANVGGYYYYVVPIVGNELVCSQIKFNTTKTNAASITLTKGNVYTVNL